MSASGVIGIKFENTTKIYGFKADGMELGRGDRVVVESELGMSIGRVVSVNFPIDDPSRELKPILRKVSEEDLAKQKENASLKAEARGYFNERVMARGLPMKLVTTDTTLDRKRLIFYFVADTRIDFRELVKDLASRFRTRIELRQIGVRDAAMIAGGYGICGKECCCRSFLRGFQPISIKMAKQQELVLNVNKLSGVCGRLLCCLNYEYDSNPNGRKHEETVEEPAAESIEAVENKFYEGDEAKPISEIKEEPKADIAEEKIEAEKAAPKTEAPSQEAKGEEQTRAMREKRRRRRWRKHNQPK